MEKESKSVGVEEDALNRVRWRVGVGEIAVKVGYIWPPPFKGIKPDQNWMMICENEVLKLTILACNSVVM